MTSITWKWVALIASLCLLCAPALHAAPIKKTVESKVELKPKNAKSSIKKSLKGQATIDKLANNKVNKSLSFKLKGDDIGGLKPDKLKAESKFDLSGKSPKVKSLKVALLKKDQAGKKERKAVFNLPAVQLALNFDRDKMISGFSLSFLANGKPVLDELGSGLSLLGITARVPEPATLLLLAGGLLGLAGAGVRRRKPRAA